jgi:hypothetical protein
VDAFAVEADRHAIRHGSVLAETKAKRFPLRSEGEIMGSSDVRGTKTIYALTEVDDARRTG